MKGHEQILSMRIDGLHPAEVVVTDLPLNGGLERHVYIESTDAIDALDLRFLKDMLVHVSVSEGFRGQRIADACKEHAQRVIASFYKPNTRLSVRMTDTQENREWKF